MMPHAPLSAPAARSGCASPLKSPAVTLQPRLAMPLAPSRRANMNGGCVFEAARPRKMYTRPVAPITELGVQNGAPTARSGRVSPSKSPGPSSESPKYADCGLFSTIRMFVVPAGEAEAINTWPAETIVPHGLLVGQL